LIAAIELPEMVLLPGGIFLMGSDSGREDEAPPHEVELRRFYMARYGVTNGEFARFLAQAGSPPPPCWNQPPFDSPNQPVVAVSWYEACSFCEWLSGLTGERYSLPTEAEREYACRAGSSTAFPWGNETGRDTGGYGARWSGGAPEVVGGPPNAFGLCNLADNVHEWCWDWYDRDYYRRSPSVDPRGPESGTRKVSRGGSWRHRVKVTRSTARSSIPPGFRYTDYGFRVVKRV
jgi:formylglycine-generating enzyme required for sulfatase activity